MGAILTNTIRFRPLAVASRLAVLLMVIAVGACDNVEWGGFGLSIVPPPAPVADTSETRPARLLPEGPVLFYVHRDSAGVTVIPVGQVTDAGLAPIAPGDDPDTFAARFIDAFFSPGTELALFRRAQRVGIVTVSSAALPTDPVCRPLPRATGSAQLASGIDDVTEFLALSSVAAPETQAARIPDATRSMQVVSDMMAGEMFRARSVAVPSLGAARRQLVPFPLAGTTDPGFTATYLVDDTLGLGDDDAGAALFVVFTPRGQTGYDSALVGFDDYTGRGKAAPRVIDFLDWDGDGNMELLLEVFGTSTSWFRAVGLRDGEWRRIFQDRCDPRTAPVGPDSTDEGAATESQPPRNPPRAPATRPTLDEIPDIEPTIQLSNPAQSPSLGPATTRGQRTEPDTVPPDTGAAGRS